MTHYEVLGVAVSASPEAIKQAFFHRARKCHPDKRGGDAALMQRLSAAYAVLSDPAKRQRYDAAMGLTELPQMGVIPELDTAAFAAPPEQKADAQ